VISLIIPFIHILFKYKATILCIAYLSVAFQQVVKKVEHCPYRFHMCIHRRHILGCSHRHRFHGHTDWFQSTSPHMQVLNKNTKHSLVYNSLSTIKLCSCTDDGNDHIPINGHDMVLVYVISIVSSIICCFFS